jgi:hypothetical protein
MAAAQILLAKDAPSMFRLQRLRDTAKPKTQFEKKQSS